MLSLAPLSRTQVVPASACVHSVIVMAVGSSANVVNVDRCVATFVVPAFGRPYVVSKAYHVMGKYGALFTRSTLLFALSYLLFSLLQSVCDSCSSVASSCCRQSG